MTYPIGFPKSSGVMTRGYFGENEMIGALTKNKKALTLTFVFLFTALVIQSSYADYYPSGPATNVSEQTLIDNGWVKTYEQTYQTQILDDGVGLRPTGAYTILSGKAVGSSTISLLAAAPTADVFTQTTGNNTRLVNGTYWYYVPRVFPNDGSIGFADTATVTLQTGDVNTSSSNRLSWHINLTSQAPGFNGGYRLGTTLELNGSTAYLKQVWTWNGPNVPAPPAPVEVAVRKNSNLQFNEALYESDKLSDPDGQLRKTVDAIDAKYGYLIK
jgi:hypothetical protein